MKKSSLLKQLFSRAAITALLVVVIPFCHLSAQSILPANPLFIAGADFVNIAVEPQENTSIVADSKPMPMQLTAFPNPSKGHFTLLSTRATGYAVIDATGQIVDKGQLNGSNNYTVNVKGLSRGLYFIMAGDDLQTTVIVTK